MKKCGYCGKEFEGHFNSRYCSAKCKDSFKLNRPTGKSLACVVCGKIYTERYKHRRYKKQVCSVNCGNVFHSKAGRIITIGEIEDYIKYAEKQPTINVVADSLGTSRTTVLSRAKESYGDFRTMVRELRGNYKDSVLKGHGKTAEFLFDMIDSLGFKGTREFTFIDCNNPKTGYPLRFDYFIDNVPLAIEYHGSQHFKDTSYFYSGNRNDNTFAEQQYRDSVKEQYLKDKGIPLVVFTFDEPLTLDYVTAKLSTFTTKENTETALSEVVVEHRD